MSNIVHKVKDAVTGHPNHKSDNTHSTTGVGQGNHGTQTTQGTTHSTHGGTASSTRPPHSSKVANKLDPRVDSQATTGAGPGTHGTHAGMTSGTQPPHSSTTANKLDPRVDSQAGTGASYGTHGTHSGMTSGTQPPHTSTAQQSSKLGGNGHMGHGALGGAGAGLGAGTTHHATGHHSSEPGLMQANPLPSSTKASRGVGVGGVGDTSSALGSGTGHHSAGHHGSNVMHSSVGSGTASRTAGPHDSNLANKLDPRVDSDLDGSRTVGRGATHNSRTGNFDNKDPTDAAQVPPSVMSKHVGAPEVTHNDPKHERTRRHSMKPGDSLREYGSGTV
ncbi:hypothetical protein RJZ56_004440 [Blastomyces dermatitidis]|uniref:Cell surface protein n=2 Tax=Ajellomyces dermatitidis TaxID=5039 RepID=F2TM05_AJEDA|nr:uncharacterized protein BDCG_09062 [Blastomyces dermatitidis ER-3]EEQ85793.1 hypothetical protein BDCG_09062 [Blastomyces dermatitidis ER-3]EGE84268.1 hypothetical protein BDDG_07213 [Blastomyces dermatitidis ATCC 18188]EQL34075.1 hypothetical protein BDFG_03991 [Blastomyces dermatitidis ATCC 26199]